MNILDTFCTRNNIKTIVDNLMAKGTEVLNEYKEGEYANVTNDNIDFPLMPGDICNMKTIEIFSEQGMSEKTQNIFQEEIKLLSKITNLKRALYIFVSPHTVIPNHIDNDDESFRIVTSVFTPSTDIEQIGLIVDSDLLEMKHNKTIGLAAPEVWHNGWNKTDQYWTFLTLCIKDEMFDGIRKIY